jgi:hypothetical protein
MTKLTSKTASQWISNTQAQEWTNNRIQRIFCNSHRNRVRPAPPCAPCMWDCRTCNTQHRHHTGAGSCSAGCMSCWGEGRHPSLVSVLASAPDTVLPCQLLRRVALLLTGPCLQNRKLCLKLYVASHKCVSYTALRRGDVCVTLGFYRGLNEIFTLLGCYQRRVVVTDVSEQTIGQIFKG